MADTPRYLERPLLEQLMFGSGRVRRFTQDSPVLPDVWFEYALDPGQRPDRMTRMTSSEERPAVNLLLTPYRSAPAGDVRSEVRRRVERERGTPAWTQFGHEPASRPRIVYNQSTVAATLYFEDLVRAIIPMTFWWSDRVTKHFDPLRIDEPPVQAALAEAMCDPEHPPSQGLVARIPPDVLWLIRVVGAIALLHRGDALPAVFSDGSAAAAKSEDWLQLVRAVADLLRGVEPPKETPRIYSVALNRVASMAISASTLAVKADAARRLFGISCKDIRWAVLDSGIDATHPAFRKPKEKNKEEKPDGQPFVGYDSRIRATYDFAQIHLLLDPDDPADQPERVKQKLDADPKLQEQLDDLNEALSDGRSIDWSMIAPMLRIEHDAKYGSHIPSIDHGTHVAGIIGANLPADKSDGATEVDLLGVCPDIELYDLRILDKDGNGDEFTVMAALQFVRWLNSTNDYMAVHGVNMSLSIPHDVANYACGRTPVCDEAERAVSSGIVVVVAAGNQGYRKYTTADGMTSEAYNTISITDPGNADLVITVGATHRARPHTYGVSYFSSRGPTADGRLKPDLVAPGEKITAPLPNGMVGLKDGTSMAAPHVSGAAALLMARHDELIGKPMRIKQILCSTATDLSRERYFQGAGMLDILRAVQSV